MVGQGRTGGDGCMGVVERDTARFRMHIFGREVALQLFFFYLITDYRRCPKFSPGHIDEKYPFVSVKFGTKYKPMGLQMRRWACR